MFTFSKKSKERLQTCHPDLQVVLNEAIKETDFTVLCGHRGEIEQNEAFAKGNSKLKFPRSKHNSNPSKAVDVAPYPIDWNDIERFTALAVIIKRIADAHGINITWGGDWKTFKDYPHFELTV